MAYEKTNWISTTPINTTNLNKIEAVIEQNSNDIETLNTNVGELSSLDTTEKSNLVDAINELKEETNDSGWVELTLLTGTATAPLRIRKIGKIVYLNGVIKDVSETIQITNIPEGYRPTSQQTIFACSNSRIQINNDGKTYTLEPTGTIGINCTYFVD